MLVSIILPTYNRADTFLYDAIKSVVGQTYKRWELLVGDNCSTDNTEEVVKSFGDRRIKYFKAKENSGTPNTFINKAAKFSRAKYIAFIDDDSRFFPNHIKLLLAKAQEGYKVCYCYAFDSYLDKNLKIEKQFARNIPWNRSKFIRAGAHNNWVGLMDMLMSRKAFLEFGGLREDACFQDYAILAKLCMKYPVGVVPHCLTEELRHDRSSDYSDHSDDMEKKYDIF